MIEKQNLLARSIEAFNWSDTEPGRVFYGRGHSDSSCNHINIDWLPPVALITLYREWDESGLQRLIEKLLSDTGNYVSSILLQRRYRKPVCFEAVAGEPVRQLVMEEAGLRYRLNFDSGMHTGLFLDMAAARRWLRAHAENRRVLNLFAYTCAFSVAAVAGGADSVVNIDMSSSALAKGRENHRLNGHDLRNVSFLAHDIFRSWGKLKRKGPYGLVVVDPPSRQPGSFVAVKDYARLLRRLPEMLSPGADLLFCLNDPGLDSDFLVQTIAANGNGFEFQSRLANPPGFEDFDPERGLKILHYRYRPPGKA